MGAATILTGVLVPAASAAAPDRSGASASAIGHEIRFDRTTSPRRALAVSMQFRVDTPGPVGLSLPAWTPGANEISNFARKVSGFAASAEGRPLARRVRDGILRGEVER